MKSMDILSSPITLHIPMVAPLTLQYFQVFQNTTHTTLTPIAMISNTTASTHYPPIFQDFRSCNCLTWTAKQQTRNSPWKSHLAVTALGTIIKIVVCENSEHACQYQK